MQFLAQHVVGEQCADGRTVPGCPPAPALSGRGQGRVGCWLALRVSAPPCWLCGHLGLNMPRRATHAGVGGVAGMCIITMSHPAFKGLLLGSSSLTPSLSACLVPPLSTQKPAMQEFHDGFHLPSVLHVVPPAPEVSLEGLTADPILTGWSAESSACRWLLPWWGPAPLAPCHPRSPGWGGKS